MARAVEIPRITPQEVGYSLASSQAGRRQDLVSRISPEILIPIHTEYPEMLKGIVKDTLIVEKNKEYAI